MVEKRVPGENELSGLSNFSRWYYGQKWQNTAQNVNGSYANGHYMLEPTLSGGHQYVGIGNSVIIETNMYNISKAYDLGTDIVAVDVALFYTYDITSISDKRDQNVNQFGWDHDTTTAMPQNLVAKPHPVVQNTTILECSPRVFRLWNPRTLRPVVDNYSWSWTNPIIRDVAAGDNIMVYAYFVPRNFSTTSQSWILYRGDYIQMRMCFGGHARTH